MAAQTNDQQSETMLLDESETASVEYITTTYLYHPAADLVIFLFNIQFVLSFYLPWKGTIT